MSPKADSLINEILRRLYDRQPYLTSSERRVAQWLERSLDTAAFQTANEVSKSTGVSESTIVRFARKLGYDSYPAMQREIQEVIQQQFSLGDKFRHSLSHDPQDVISKTYHRDLNNLKVTYEQLDPRMFHTCVAKIAKARRVAVLGLRASASPAVYLSFALNLVRPNVTQLRLELDNIHDQLLDFSDKDVLISFSLARPARRTIQTVKQAKQRYSVCVIGITHSRVSPLGQLADHTLIASAEGTFNSYTAIMSLCGALMEAVANVLRDKAEARLRRLDGINGEDVVVK